jgi:hypothetical protein
MRLGRSKEPEPEPAVIRVTANGETPVRGRGRKTPAPAAPEKPATTRELLGGYKEQPLYAAREKGGSDFNRDLGPLLEEKRYEDPPDRDWLKLITGAVFGFLSVCLIALGAILFSLPASPANIAWIHAETATIGILLVLLYLKK